MYSTLRGSRDINHIIPYSMYEIIVCIYSNFIVKQISQFYSLKKIVDVLYFYYLLHFTQVIGRVK